MSGSSPRTVSRSAVEGAATPAADNTAASDATEGDGSGDTPATPAAKKDDLNDEKAELERAIALEQEAYQLGEKTRKDSIVTQASRSGGDVNHDAANTAGERAAERLRDKALKKRPKGVYVTSPIKVRGQDGPVFAPVGFRLTDYMVSQLGDKQISELEQQELVTDLR